MKKAFLIISICICKLSFGCLNGESKILKDGTFLYQDLEGSIPFGHEFNHIEDFERGIIKLDSLYKATKDLDYLSDKGLLLILLKKYDKAINLYLEIENIQPNRYSTASNIGTAYELIGQNDKALNWINKSIKINPTAHFNSEWIHSNILQAKIKGDSYINSSFLINTKFSSTPNDFDSPPETKLSQDELRKLSDALYYQLNERVSFIKNKDNIVSNLMFYLGDLNYLQKNYIDAFVIYAIARKYSNEVFHKHIDQRIDVVSTSLSSKLDNLNFQLAQANKHEISNTKLEKIYFEGLEYRTKVIYVLSSIIVLLVIVCIYFKINSNR